MNFLFYFLLSISLNFKLFLLLTSWKLRFYNIFVLREISKELSLICIKFLECCEHVGWNAPHRRNVVWINFIGFALFCPKLRLTTRHFQKLQQNFSYHFEQNKSKDSKSHSSPTSTKSEAETTSINLSNDTESIKKQEPKKKVNIVISYIEKNDEQGIGQLVNLLNLKTFVFKHFGL